MQRSSKEGWDSVATLLVVLFSMNQARPIFLSHKHKSGYWNGFLFTDAKLKMDNFAFIREDIQDDVVFLGLF